MSDKTLQDILDGISKPVIDRAWEIWMSKTPPDEIDRFLASLSRENAISMINNLNAKVQEQYEEILKLKRQIKKLEVSREKPE